MRYKTTKALLILLFLIFSQAHSGNTEDLECDIYLTDDHHELANTLKTRAELYSPELRNSWKTLPAKIQTTKQGEEILLINGFEVMRGFEKPYMERLAQIATQAGGKVLNVGFGLGFIDNDIEELANKNNVTDHYIIELNEDVLKAAHEWRKKQINPERIHILEGDWKKVLIDLNRRGIVFDGIVYDAFPLEAQDIHRDFIPFAKELLRLKLLKETTGILTFYVDSLSGLGNKFKKFIRGLGVQSIHEEKVSVSLPPNQYWEADFFFAPTLSNVKYEK